MGIVHAQSSNTSKKTEVVLVKRYEKCNEVTHKCGEGLVCLNDKFRHIVVDPKAWQHQTGTCRTKSEALHGGETEFTVDGCDLRSGFCGRNQGAFGGGEMQAFICQKNPKDPSCIKQTICQKNPKDPSCIPPKK
jgi:hypothetical protein